MDQNTCSLVRLLDKKVEEKSDPKPRTHLGASIIGKKCVRQVWYNWRWAHITKHQGRLLRLFERGHREEPIFINYLRDLGITVREYKQRLVHYNGRDDADRYKLVDWDQPMPAYYADVSESDAHVSIAAKEYDVKVQQIGFADHDGHFGGSCDGLLSGLEQVIPGWHLDGPGLAEFKTHGEKSFIDLAGKLADWRAYCVDPVKRTFPGKGVISSKPEHYVQMQIYMHYLGLKWALYMAVCKNTDDLYFEIVHYKKELAEAYVDRAASVIKAPTAPPKISNDPAWWECKFCDFREICHHSKDPQKNCRSCIYARVNGPDWYCERYHQTIPKDFMTKGCDDWDGIL